MLLCMRHSSDHAQEYREDVVMLLCMRRPRPLRLHASVHVTGRLHASVHVSSVQAASSCFCARDALVPGKRQRTQRCAAAAGRPPGLPLVRAPFALGEHACADKLGEPPREDSALSCSCACFVRYLDSTSSCCCACFVGAVMLLCMRRGVVMLLCMRRP